MDNLLTARAETPDVVAPFKEYLKDCHTNQKLDLIDHLLSVALDAIHNETANLKIDHEALTNEISLNEKVFEKLEKSLETIKTNR